MEGVGSRQHHHPPPQQKDMVGREEEGRYGERTREKMIAVVNTMIWREKIREREKSLLWKFEA
jgi:hypothetical protein